MIHELFRLSIGFFLDSVLRVLFPDCLLVRRNSSTREHSFSILFSDFDYTLIRSDWPSDWPTEWGDKRLAVYRTKTRWLKRFVPWLGEFELYTSAEYTRMNELMLSVGSIYAKIRALRKSLWMLKLWRESRSSPYLRRKYARAWHNALKTIDCVIAIEDPGINIEESLAPYFKTIPSWATEATPITVKAAALETAPAQGNSYVHYLSCYFGEVAGTAQDGQSVIPIEHSLTAEILACIPVLGNRLASPESKKLSELESLIVRAAIRGSSTLDPGLVNWLNQLIDHYSS